MKKMLLASFCAVLICGAAFFFYDRAYPIAPDETEFAPYIEEALNRHRPQPLYNEIRTGPAVTLGREKWVIFQTDDLLGRARLGRA